MRLFHIAVEGFEIELELAEVLGLELFDFQFDADKSVQCPVEEEKVDCEVAATDLERILAANKAKISTEFDQELFELHNKAALEVGFRVAGRKVEKLQQIGILKNANCLGVDVQNRLRQFGWRKYGPLEESRVELSFEIPLPPLFTDAKSEIEFAFFVPLTPAHDEQVVSPG